VTRQLDRRPTLFILGYRFVYGMRTVALVTIGLSRITALRFLALNAISAGVWSILVTGAGYAFGHATRLVLQDLERYEGWIVAGVVLLVALALAVIRVREGRRNGDGSDSRN
jgi:membrane protein DedA with SNARE-associated domain